MLRRATLEDIPAIFNLVRKWASESPMYAEEGCEITVINTLNQCLGVDFIIYEHEGKPIGLHIWTKERYFTKRPYGCMFLFYVHPDYRNGTVARDLLRYGLDDCRRDCIGFYATATAAFDDSGLNARAFSIMLRREGFKAHGNAMFLSMGDL